MTEWRFYKDPEWTRRLLNGIASDRKLRLFAVACCRRIWHLMKDERYRSAVEVAERYADSLVDRARLMEARDEARKARRESHLLPKPASVGRAATAAFDVTRDTGKSAACNCFYEAAQAMNLRDTNQCDEGELLEQARILHCVFGLGLCSVTFDRLWLTSTVISLAGIIYDTRSFDRMPELASVLETAGCSSPEVLTHCRKPGPHARGCWVVDLILGRC